MRENIGRLGASVSSALESAEASTRAFVDRVGAERLWAATVLALVAVLALGSLLFPQQVYVDFIWQYYWGPVYADAHGLGTNGCVAWADGAHELYGNCANAPADAGPTASPGYTFVSYAGYIPTLVLFLVGLLFLIRRLEVTRYRAGFYALFPFMLFGGALRTVEDANVAAPDLLLPVPWTALIISPFIYFTVALVAAIALTVSVVLERRGYVSGYEYPLFGFGTAAFVLTVGYLSYLAATEPWVDFHAAILVLTLVGATAATGLAWWGIVRFAPEINQGTLYMGVIVIWAHAVDGVANVIGLDWASSLGWEHNLSPKHPINAAIVEYTGALLPSAVTEVTGQAWPFLIVKIAAAIAIIWVFDESVFEESPRYAYLLMVTVVAVGLGPGTRDMLRAVFGI
ncbi:DUF63 family protein [Natronobiforma cellulositropha]|uniref:DUF63 family protein n=1 Tax=Natronobiforma cellulositropha TaxID=1679076 RepID=UPI0021D603E9|nr:DUF63 family protein [Natronobiforma cellulositropha]